MTDKPILFSPPMVAALIEGRKTQTRRLLNPQPPSVEAVHHLAGINYHWIPAPPSPHFRPVGPVWAVRNIWDGKTQVTPPYAVGDRLSVEASDSRMTLLVTDVRVQRVQEISVDDAIAEGIDLDYGCCGQPYFHQTGECHGWPEGSEECCGNPEIMTDPTVTFANLWNNLHADPGTTWEDNPWIVAYTFEVEK